MGTAQELSVWRYRVLLCSEKGYSLISDASTLYRDSRAEILLVFCITSSDIVGCISVPGEMIFLRFPTNVRSYEKYLALIY